MQVKKNCWEFKKCGREPGGRRVHELGICPATKEARLNGVHGGYNGGRSCWVVAGSLCGGEIQGTFAQKFHNCNSCDYYNTVRQEEGGGFQLSAVLLEKVKTIGNCKAAAVKAGEGAGSIKVRRNHW
jgi:hypothetical protein